MYQFAKKANISRVMANGMPSHYLVLAWHQLFPADANNMAKEPGNS